MIWYFSYSYHKKVGVPQPSTANNIQLQFRGNPGMLFCVQVYCWLLITLILLLGTGMFRANLVNSLCPWRRHQMEAFSVSLAICAGNSPASGEFPAQRPVTRSVDVFFDLCLNKRLRKQSWGWWFETLSRPLWRHGNATRTYASVTAGQ